MPACTQGDPAVRLISVIIDTYNYGRFIEKAIDSVINQDFPENDFEIIVVDDGSMDGTQKIVRKYKDKIKYIYKENAGQASAFNAGFENAHGRIIVFLDSDDYYQPNKLERIAKEFQACESIDVVYHCLSLVDKDYRIIGEWPDRKIEIEKHPLKSYLSGKTPFAFPTPSICVRADCLKKIMPIPEGFNITADSYIIYSLPFVAREFALINEKLANLMVHDSSYWSARGLTAQILAERIRKHELNTEYVQKWVKKLGLDFRLLKIELETVAAGNEILFLNLCGKKIRAIQKALYFKGAGSKGGILYRIFQKISMFFLAIIPHPSYLRLSKIYKNSFLFRIVHYFLLHER